MTTQFIGTDNNDTIKVAISQSNPDDDPSTIYADAKAGDDLITYDLSRWVNPFEPGWAVRGILKGGSGADTFKDTSRAVDLYNALDPSKIKVYITLQDFNGDEGDILDLSGTQYYPHISDVITKDPADPDSILLPFATSMSIHAYKFPVTIVYRTGGHPLTFNNIRTSLHEPTSGTAASDLHVGSAKTDYMQGFAGDDTLHGGANNDTLIGGDGHDSMHGGDDHDLLHGNQGDDTLHGENGSDTVFAGQGNDTATGGTGTDLLLGDNGNDSMHGGQSNDSLGGGAGDDTLHGDKGNDLLIGNLGADTFMFTAGHGNDTVVDFVHGEDHLAFSHDLFTNAAAAVAAFSNGVITTHDGIITLTGITTITESDVKHHYVKLVRFKPNPVRFIGWLRGFD